MKPAINLTIGLILTALALLALGIISAGAMWALFVNPYTKTAFWLGLFIVWVAYSNRRLFQRRAV